MSPHLCDTAGSTLALGHRYSNRRRAFLFTELNDAVATAGILAGIRTGVRSHQIAIIALFIGIDAPIAALEQTSGITAITGNEITVVTGLSGVDLIIATLKGGQADRWLLTAGQGMAQALLDHLERSAILQVFPLRQRLQPPSYC